MLSLAALMLLSCLSAATALADDPVGAGGAVIASTDVTLREGDRGAAVRKLQRRLDVAADGVFGPQTDAAVRRFQRQHDLEVDGIVGPATRNALGLPRFSASSVRHAPAEGGDGGGSGVKLPAVLNRIAQCESGGDPRAVSSNGLYRGKYQFARETWKSMGGRGSDPAKASEAHQDRIALKLYKASGTAPWPTCGA